VLRVCMGIVIFGFGVLKYFPGVSPAQGIVLAVNRILTFGLLPDQVTLPLFATVEAIIGLSLITGRGLRLIIYPLGVWAVAILSPLVLLTGQLFSAAHHAPTLMGQYVFKDIILLAAVLVVAADVRRGNRFSLRG
jgi:putative oxidoreductase